MTLQPLVAPAPPPEAVTVRADLHYGDGVTFDLYRPAHAGGPLPAVVFVSGYPDEGFAKMLGCKLKHMQAYVDWARLAASRGLAAITYDNRTPAEDLGRLLAHLRDHGDSLGVDPSRLALWAASGNAPTALDALCGQVAVRAAAVLYGYTLDLDGSTVVAEAAAQIGFANPAASMRVSDLPDVPLLLVRAGADETPGLNATIDAFISAAIAADRPLTVVAHPRAPHAFDMMVDDDRSRRVIDDTLRFLGAILARPLAGRADTM